MATLLVIVATVALLFLTPAAGPPMMASRAAGLRPALNVDHPSTPPPKTPEVRPPADEDQPAATNDPPPTPDLAGSYAPDSRGLQFVYFVEADRSFDPTAPVLIEQQARALQAAWQAEFGGTFPLADPVVAVVEGEHTARWYVATVNGDIHQWFRLRNIRAETRAALGIADDDPARLIIYPEATVNGLVGANRYDDAVLDGDDITCIDGTTDTVPYEDDYPADCLDTALHELGHVYGLTHRGPDSGCMQLGFYRYLTGHVPCRFSPVDTTDVWADPNNLGWLSSAPGDQAPAGPGTGQFPDKVGKSD
ncbi:MAG: hypothetical protein ACK5PP_06250 [Acidimicrobiales bacterium]